MARLLLDPRGVDGAPRAPENDNRFFRRHIRLNNAFAFSSIQAKRHPAASSPNAPPVHVLQGSIYSVVGTMAATSDREPAFLQLWLDGEGATRFDSKTSQPSKAFGLYIERRRHQAMAYKPKCFALCISFIVNWVITSLLQPFGVFTMTHKSAQRFARVSSTDTLRLEVIDGSGTATAPVSALFHGLHQANWIAIRIAGPRCQAARTGARQPGAEHCERRKSVLRLAFPLLFPRGEPGYRAGIPASHRDRPITRREFYCFLTHVRWNDPAFRGARPWHVSMC